MGSRNVPEFAANRCRMISQVAPARAEGCAGAGEAAAGAYGVGSAMNQEWQKAEGAGFLLNPFIGVLVQPRTETLSQNLRLLINATFVIPKDNRRIFILRAGINTVMIATTVWHERHETLRHMWMELVSLGQCVFHNAEMSGNAYT
jgi:hypothetical protein